MLTYESSAFILAPADAAWSVLSDVSQWPRWLPTVSAVQPLDAPALRPGARYLVRQPRLRPATWTVTELDAPHRFVWQARSPGLLMQADHVVVAASATSTQVRLRYSFGGLLGGLLGLLFGALTRRYLAQEATALKQRLEAAAAPPGR